MNSDLIFGKLITHVMSRYPNLKQTLVDKELADNVYIVIPVPGVSMIVFGYLDKIGIQSMINMLGIMFEFKNTFLWNSNPMGILGLPGRPRLEHIEDNSLAIRVKGYYNWRNLNQKDRYKYIINRNRHVAKLPPNY